MKTFFPTSYSTLSPEALADWFTDRYESGPAKCKLIVRGVGDTYLVETKTDRFILRIYRLSHRDFRQIQSEIALLTSLMESNVSVSYPLADKNGNMIHAFDAIEGLRYGVIFTYAPGVSVTTLNKQQLRSFGNEMARFHNISAITQLNDNRWRFNVDTTLHQPLAMAKDAFAEDPEGYAWLLTAAKQAESKLVELNTSGFSTGYCHFDFLPKNFHFDEDDRVTLFDFDFFGFGWLVNDIMTFWQHLCLDVFFNRMTQEEADKSFSIFLEAYREHRPINEEELKAIPWLSLGFWLFYMGFHTTHDQFYPVIFQPAQLKLRTGVIRKLMERYWVN